MKKVVISALAVVAFGATFGATRTASAEGWVSSNWNYFPGQWPFSISDGFGTLVDINDSAAQGTTLSTSTTGVITNSSFTNQTGNCNGPTCPTSHWAFALCSDNTFFTGPIMLDYRTDLSQQPTYSWTGSASGFLAGYWTSTGQQITPDTGLCPSPTYQTAGGVWIYKYSTP